MILKNKKLIIYIALFILYIFFIVFSFINIDSYSSVNSVYIEKPVIIIDPGHGGEDGGAATDNIVEKNINLEISKKLNYIFKASGFNVKMTRNSDKMINSYGTSLRERKVSDMKNRLSMYNSSENNIVVSIHQNKFPQEKYNGTQIFYSTNNKNSQILADNIKTNVKNLLQPDNEREIKPADRNIYLLYNSKVPSVIVECGFISNYNDAEKLQNNEYQNKLVFAIFSGVMEYYNNK